MANGNGQDAASGWMSDVQRALALILIGTVAFMVVMLTLRIVWSGDLPTISALLKELKDALTNMSLIALGFFFGNTMAKMAQDAGQQKVVEKLTSPQGPVAPVTSEPITVVSWWSLLTSAEQAAIEAAAAATPVDARMVAITAAFKSGKAEAPDLADLVARGLLTQVRADEIKAT